MVDPDNHIEKVVSDVYRYNDPKLGNSAISVLVNRVLTDFADEVAELVAGRLVISGVESEVALEIVDLIKYRAKRFNVG